MLYRIKKDEKISDIVDNLDIPYSLISRYNPFVESMDGTYQDRVLTLPLTYTALPGDTYESIGQSFGILPLYMRELNPHTDTSSIIYPGQPIFLPPNLVF